MFLTIASVAAPARLGGNGSVAALLGVGVERQPSTTLCVGAARLHDAAAADLLGRVKGNPFAAAVDVGDTASTAQLAAVIKDRLSTAFAVREPVAYDTVAAGLHVWVNPLAVAAVIAIGDHHSAATAQIILGVISELPAALRVRPRAGLDAIITANLCYAVSEWLSATALAVDKQKHLSATTGTRVGIIRYLPTAFAVRNIVLEDLVTTYFAITNWYTSTAIINRIYNNLSSATKLTL